MLKSITYSSLICFPLVTVLVNHITHVIDLVLSDLCQELFILRQLSIVEATFKVRDVNSIIRRRFLEILLQVVNNDRLT